ncbi:MAG: restriction endonuclease subunit S [Gammaproteobacteria bacterium]
MEVRPGYKQTEVGVLPVDWQVVAVGDEFFLQLGKMLDSEKNVGVSKPFLGNRAVQWGRFDLSDIGVVKLAPSDLQRFRLRDGDLLVCEGGEIGRCAIWNEAIEECYYQKALHRLRPKRGYNVALMLNVLRRLASTGFLLNFVTQTSIAHLPKDKFETVPIPVPPTKAEQEAIAEALSDADAFIESLEQLIAKKCDLKQAAMQQLLPGQTRLPGFSGEWEVKRLANLAQIVSGGTPKTSNPTYWNGTVKWCTPTDITGCSGKYLAETERSITREGLASCSAQLLPAGTLLLCSRATIGELKIAATEVCTNQGFKSLICNRDVSNEFLYYKLLTMKSQMIERAIGSTFLEISKRDTAALEVSLPELGEQTAIATVLSDMDAEIAALEARRDKTRLLKQGMMQELLTGRIRLV